MPLIATELLDKNSPQEMRDVIMAALVDGRGVFRYDEAGHGWLDMYSDHDEADEAKRRLAAQPNLEQKIDAIVEDVRFIKQQWIATKPPEPQQPFAGT